MRTFRFGPARQARLRLGVILGLVLLPALAVSGESSDLRQLQALTRQAQGEYRAGNLDAALVVSRRAVDGARLQFGENHIHTAQALNNLALFQDLGGALADAAGNYRKAIAIVEANADDNGTFLADLKNNLAAVVLQQCRLAEARGLYADALSLTEARYGSYHRETELVRANVEQLDRFVAGQASKAQAAAFGQLLKYCTS